MSLNLIDNYFQDSHLFKCLPIFDEIYYHGLVQGKVQLFKALREEEECQLLAAAIIRHEEDMFWEATEDFLQRSLMTAGPSLHGIYTFDLLAFDIHRELKTFKFQELAAILVNYSRKLKPGQPCLVKYSSLYGILQKFVHEDWGKITLKTSTEVFKDKPSLLYLLVKRLLSIKEMSHGPLIVFMHDLSLEPIFNVQDRLQQEGLSKIMKEKLKDFIDFPPEVYIQDKNGTRELLSGSVIT